MHVAFALRRRRPELTIMRATLPLCLIALATARGEEAACNESTREAFERDGYVVLRNVLTAEEVDGIERMFDSLTHPNDALRSIMGRDYGDQ